MAKNNFSDESLKIIEKILNLHEEKKNQISILKDLLSSQEQGLKGLSELEFILDQFKDKQLESVKLEFDLSLARGLHYYTGMIIEVKAPDAVKIGSIGDEGRYAYDTASYSEKEIRRFARAGFYFAQRRKGKLVSADKANVMESYKLWRSVTEEMSAEFPEINYASMYADNCAYQMIKRPKDFDVIMGCNFLGDILSDLAAIISGGLGMLPSACLCDAHGEPVKGIYEPVHGSAPDIAGQNIANPVGMILSVAMMFEYSIGMPELAKEIERSVEVALGKDIRTPDLGGDSSTQAVTDSIIAEILNR